MLLAFIAFSFVAHLAVIGAFLLFGFYATPFIVVLWLEKKVKYDIPLFILLVSTFLYASWLAYVFVNSMIINLDPQSGIALFLAGIMSLPIMIPIWMLAMVLDAYYAKKQEPQV